MDQEGCIEINNAMACQVEITEWAKVWSQDCVTGSWALATRDSSVARTRDVGPDHGGLKY